MSSRALRTVVVWGWVSQFALLTAGSAWWHDHGPAGLSHPHVGTCGSGAADDSDGTTCCPGRSHRHAADRTAADRTAADAGRTAQGPQLARGFAAHDCAVCRFLAQPQSPAGPSAATVQVALAVHEPTLEPQGPARPALDVPAARGPPGSLAG
jgi:hypothetical protein